MNFDSLKKMNKADLLGLLADKKKQLLSLKFEKLSSQNKFSTAKIKDLRRDIARVFTALPLVNNK